MLENAPKFREKLAEPKVGQRTVAENLAEIAMASISFFEKLFSARDFALLEHGPFEAASQSDGRAETWSQDVFALVVVLNDSVDLRVEIVEGEEHHLNLVATVGGRVLLVVTT